MSIESAIARVDARVRASAEAVAKAQKAATDLSQTVLTEVLALDGDDRQRLMHYVYWNVEDVPARVFEAVAGGGRRAWELVGAGPCLGACDECGEQVHPGSRTERKEVRQHDTLRCRPCRQTELRAQQEAWRRQLSSYDDDAAPVDGEMDPGEHDWRFHGYYGEEYGYPPQ
jgi:hypothetical protein